jgi:hypothetical protein
MRTQANNLVNFREFIGGVHAPSSQITVCVFSLGEMWLQLPVDSTNVKRTVANDGGYRSRIRVVIDP